MYIGSEVVTKSFGIAKPGLVLNYASSKNQRGSRSPVDLICRFVGNNVSITLFEVYVLDNYPYSQSLASMLMVVNI